MLVSVNYNALYENIFRLCIKGVTGKHAEMFKCPSKSFDKTPANKECLTRFFIKDVKVLNQLPLFEAPTQVFPCGYCKIFKNI